MRDIFFLVLFGMSQPHCVHQPSQVFSSFRSWILIILVFVVPFLLASAFAATISLAQSLSNQFVGCDFYQTLELNQWHDVFSPQFPRNYLPNTFCRWTACAPYGSVIVVNCTIMKIPMVSTRCAMGRYEYVCETKTYIWIRLFPRLFVRISLKLAAVIVLKSPCRDVRIWMTAQHIVRIRHLSVFQKRMRWSWVSVTEFSSEHQVNIYIWIWFTNCSIENRFEYCGRAFFLSNPSQTECVSCTSSANATSTLPNDTNQHLSTICAALIRARIASELSIWRANVSSARIVTNILSTERPKYRFATKSWECFPNLYWTHAIPVAICISTNCISTNRITAALSAGLSAHVSTVNAGVSRIRVFL